MSLPHQLPQHPTQTHATHITHPTYAPPAHRPASPASSVGTAYPPDQTSLSDSEFHISQFNFERKQELKIGLGKQRDEEKEREKEPLILVPEVPLGNNMPPNGEYPPGLKMIWVNERKLDVTEEKILFDKVMQSLREEVTALQDNEIFERILQRTQEEPPPPATQDIDSLMRSMMGNINIGMSTSVGEDWSISSGEQTARGASILGSTIGGKRSRNGTKRNT